MASNRGLLREMAVEEMDALHLISYHGGLDGGIWYADLTPDDVGKVRALLASLVEQLETQQRALERIRDWDGFRHTGEVRDCAGEALDGSR